VAVAPGDDEPLTARAGEDGAAGGVRAELHAEREAHRRTREALGRFVPPQFLDLLGKHHFSDLSLGDAVERKLTVLFLDIRGFTTRCEGMSPTETFRFVNAFFAALEPEVERHGGFVDKYMGDAIMALFPSAADGIAGAQGMLRALDGFNAAPEREGPHCVRVGIGLHTGIVTIGTVGVPGRLETTVIGDAVNVASRLEELSKTYRVPLIVSEATLYGLGAAPGSTTRFLDRIRVKGKTHPLSIYEVFAMDPPALRAAKEASRSRFEEAVSWYHHRQIERARPLLEACLAEAPGDEPVRVYLDRCQACLADGRFEGTGEVEGTVAWRPEFTVGFPAIDDQHHQLLAAFNELAPRLSAGDARGVEDTLSFLDGYVREHFGMEAELMRSSGYPLAPAHMREHRSFVEHFQRLRREIASGRHEEPFLVFLVQILLVDWFAHHSTGTDRHLARYLRSVGAR
jgi:hemerythrin-like metal-binding protein